MIFLNNNKFVYWSPETDGPNAWMWRTCLFQESFECVKEKRLRFSEKTVVVVLLANPEEGCETHSEMNLGMSVRAIMHKCFGGISGKVS
jgi:hypothetical protein